MMILPKLPYKTNKVQRQIVEFLGLNLSENTKEGELSDAYGLTTANYPCLSQRAGRTAVDGYTAPTDIFEWDGKLVVVDDGLLYYDGKPIDNVTADKKQFAVLNSQIVVLPDKLCINTVEGTYRRLGASVTTAETAGSATITENSITATLSPIIKAVPRAGARAYGIRAEDYKGKMPVVYTYGTDAEAVKGCWNAQEKCWNGLNSNETPKYALSQVPYFAKDFPTLSVGDILIPAKSGNSYSLVKGNDLMLPDTSAYNAEGYYAVITSIVDDDFQLLGTDESGPYRIYTIWSFDVYHAEIKNSLFSMSFAVGDYVDISGTAGGANDGTHKKILRIDDATNTLYFADGTFPSASTEASITIKVPFPELNFICESGNRLWGVSNKDNTIYASARGLPNDFYSYDLLSDDSYAVTVGSEGDFTAICAYGDSVLCWKEKRLHKVLGDLPKEYYLSEYEIAGVQAGSDRSLAIINETLYYKGVFGVYAYTGGVPSLISYKLGNGIFSEGVGCGHNNRYYLGVLDAEQKPMLLVYDITHGLWMKEDNIRVDAFALVGSGLYMLGGEALYKVGMGGDIPWMAEFVPFDEVSHVRKAYSKLRLRLDMGAKAWLRVEIKEDRGLWRTVYTQSATRAMTVNIPLRLGRCDRLQVRLSGKGEVMIRSMVREFYAGSEV